MAFKKSSLAKHYIGPAGELAAEVDPEDWVLIEGAKASSANIGLEWVTADGTTFDDDYRQNYKVLKDAGDLELTLQRDFALPGQNDLQAAAADKSTTTYPFKIEFDDAPAEGTPSTILFNARVLSFRGGLGGVTAGAEWKSKIDITGATSEAEAAEAEGP